MVAAIMGQKSAINAGLAIYKRRLLHLRFKCDDYDYAG